ncbi:hypothetical protein LCGC14_2172750 [marine sediment metagenome]|uniref:Uncharacterized protein n=1 Tax=marine sediment metagenome TaxID=412755 RepID=A0A0F8WUL8_9ZZZZ
MPGTPEFRAWRKAVLRWRDECWLRDWEFDIEMEEEPSHDREGEGYQLGASTDIISAYKQATVTGIKKALKERPEKVDETACHEVCHVVLSPLTAATSLFIDQLPRGQRSLAREVWKEANESVASHLQRILMWRQRSIT